MREAQVDPVICETSSPATMWTRVNLAEAIPGVCTPLGWTFWRFAAERGFRQAFADMGVYGAGDLRTPMGTEDRFLGVFHGRAVANVDKWRGIGDRLPGTSGDAVEEQFIGAVRPSPRGGPVPRRYPVVALKMPLAVSRLKGRARGCVATTDAWWRAAVSPAAQADAGGAPSRFAAAMEQFERVQRVHAFVAMFTQGLYDQTTKLAAAAGRPGLEREVTSGHGSFVEAAMVADLWEVAHGRRDLAAFLADYGYHGPSEGELSGRSWREDPTPVERLVAQYADLGGSSPAEVAVRRCEEQARAAAALLAALPASRRAGARLVLRACRAYLPFRELGKAAYLQCIDVARAAARSLGRRLEADHVLRDAEDVFFLTADEVRAGGRHVAPEVIEARRAVFEACTRVTVPDTFTGTPEALPLPGVAEAGGSLAVAGLGVSPGVVEARARVVLDLGDAAIEPGEVLVSPLTDPGWAPYFLVASALVIDIGGPLSHGALIARELGVPCVINTQDGTRRLRTGDLLRVDGTRGTVDILEPATR